MEKYFRNYYIQNPCQGFREMYHIYERTWFYGNTGKKLLCVVENPDHVLKKWLNLNQSLRYNCVITEKGYKITLYFRSDDSKDIIDETRPYKCINAESVWHQGRLGKSTCVCHCEEEELLCENI